MHKQKRNIDFSQRDHSKRVPNKKTESQYSRLLPFDLLPSLHRHSIQESLLGISINRANYSPIPRSSKSIKTTITTQFEVEWKNDVRIMDHHCEDHHPSCRNRGPQSLFRGPHSLVPKRRCRTRFPRNLG